MHVVANAGILRQERVSESRRLEFDRALQQLGKHVVGVLVRVASKGVQGFELRPRVDPDAKILPVPRLPALDR